MGFCHECTNFYEYAAFVKIYLVCGSYSCNPLAIAKKAGRHLATAISKTDIYSALVFSLVIDHYTRSISKLTSCTNSANLSSISFFVISFILLGPNFSTQKLAMALPTIMAVFILEK